MAIWFKHACPFVQMRNSLTDFFFCLQIWFTYHNNFHQMIIFFHEFSLTNDKNQPIVVYYISTLVSTKFTNGWKKFMTTNKNFNIHSSKIRGLSSMKCSSKMLWNLSYSMYKKTHIVFVVFHFILMPFAET